MTMDTSTDLDPMADLNDLGNLFEFGDIDLNNITDSGHFDDHLQQQHGTHPNTPFQELNEPTPMTVTSTHGFGGSDHFTFTHGAGQQHLLNRQKSHAPTSSPYTTSPMYQPSIQQTYNPYPPGLQFPSQPGFPPGHHVPPTPNSYEMHGETAHFLQQAQQLDPQQRAILEQRYQIRKDDAIAFTPMVSPAGTPQYNMLPEYTVPGAYFSPLTSPMLIAQNQQAQFQQLQAHRTHPNTAPNSNTISPIDPNIDLEMLDGVSLPEPAGPKTRRSRRKVATPKNTGNPGRTKQSPAQQAQKRKSLPLSSSRPHQTPEHLLQRSITSQPSSVGPQMPAQFHSSGESISPEPLSESTMGPPPRPGSSLNVSPVLLGQQQQATSSAIGAAATPKSLLATRGHQQSLNGQQDSTTSSSQSWSGLNGLDDLSLPEAAAGSARGKPSLTQINTQLEPTDENTAQISARKTPKLGPSSTPASARPPSSATNSPMIAASPMTASTPSGILTDKKENKGGRGNKKRGSMSANGSKLVSPALVPKISPSIKPLLPEGTPLNTATQAMLLASKSNYQNLLEGNHLPGVTYPDSLSTGLTSKRTSHKVAEQGRRNRINEALKEMQSLIPIKSSSRPLGSNSDDGGQADLELADENDKLAGLLINNSKELEASAKSNSSKAATVELANEYIRRMQKEQAAQTADLLHLRLENEHLKKRLQASEQGTTPADSPAPTVDSTSLSAVSSQDEEKVR